MLQELFQKLSGESLQRETKAVLGQFENESTRIGTELYIA
jgi:hypothetical protein